MVQRFGEAAPRLTQHHKRQVDPALCGPGVGNGGQLQGLLQLGIRFVVTLQPGVATGEVTARLRFGGLVLKMLRRLQRAQLRLDVVVPVAA